MAELELVEVVHELVVEDVQARVEVVVLYISPRCLALVASYTQFVVAQKELLGQNLVQGKAVQVFALIYWDGPEVLFRVESQVLGVVHSW